MTTHHHHPLEEVLMMQNNINGCCSQSHHHHQQQQLQLGEAEKKKKLVKPRGKQEEEEEATAGLKCPRCNCTNTKFCYYNNYSLSQPRHFCKGCRRYWTRGGSLRNVPVGGASRKKISRKRSYSPPASTTPPSSSSSSSSSSKIYNITPHVLSAAALPPPPPQTLMASAYSDAPLGFSCELPFLMGNPNTIHGCSSSSLNFLDNILMRSPSVVRDPCYGLGGLVEMLGQPPCDDHDHELGLGNHHHHHHPTSTSSSSSMLFSSSSKDQSSASAGLLGSCCRPVDGKVVSSAGRSASPPLWHFGGDHGMIAAGLDTTSGTGGAGINLGSSSCRWHGLINTSLM